MYRAYLNKNVKLNILFTTRFRCQKATFLFAVYYLIILENEFFFCNRNWVVNEIFSLLIFILFSLYSENLRLLNNVSPHIK